MVKSHTIPGAESTPAPEPMRVFAIASNETCTTAKMTRSIASATARIQKPAGRAGVASSMPGIIAPMIAVREGQDRILARIAAAAPPEGVPVARALGRVLADDVQAPFDVPPADNSAVDGYAVASADIPSQGTRELTVVGDLAAGAVFHGTLIAGQAMRIMTGAPMPAGSDTVYPQEV